MPKIVVKPITSTSIMVNRKVVYKDMDDKWIAVSELTAFETAAFERYIKEVIDTDAPMETKTFKI